MKDGTARSTAPRGASGLPPGVAIAFVCMTALVLEVAYTRIVSYKLWYYYTYLVIGLSLLGIGSGGILVALWKPLQRATTATVTAAAGLVGAALIAVGYGVVAAMPIDSLRIWDYGTRASVVNLLALGAMCIVLALPFIAVGVVISTILGRAGDGVGRIYFADLLGAGIGCVVAIPLIVALSPPQVVVLSAAALGAVGLLSLPRRPSPRFAVGALLTVALVAGATSEELLPAIRVEEGKISTDGSDFHDWGPVFRVDVLGEDPGQTQRLLMHDGNFGSAIQGVDGPIEEMTRFDTDPRAIPFDVLGEPPGHELIVGSAAGHEIVASIYRGATDIEAVELNPVTVDLVEHRYADYSGHLTSRPEVDLTQGDGRTYLARSDRAYDLIWFVAPDSYAANNAASSGAFVLSESYLYTRQMIEESLEHLTDDGIIAVQFGEFDFEGDPTRTSRYLVTARDALATIGVEDPSRHLLLATDAQGTSAFDLSTILVKRTPFTAGEVAAFADGLTDIPNTGLLYPGGDRFQDSLPVRIAGAQDEGTVADLVEGSDRSIGVVTDDRPFFWHFTSFPTVLSHLFEPIRVSDPEDAIGERVMVLLLGVALLLAAAFLFAPFALARRSLRGLPAPATSGLYFACLGLGFMLFEITMIQRLVRFLGYPTYSLTVTLAAILVATGVGALLSPRLAARWREPMPVLLGSLVTLALFYRFALDGITDGLQGQALAVRVLVTVLVLFPLGVCLGSFMPLGLAAVNRLSPRPAEHVAWAWAVNGFFSVIGSVLATILAMELGFRTVQLFALIVYALAAVAYHRLQRARPTPVADEDDDELEVRGEHVLVVAGD